MKRIIVLGILLAIFLSPFSLNISAKTAPMVQEVGKVVLPENSHATLVKVQDGMLLVGGFKTIKNEIGTYNYSAIWVYSLKNPLKPELLGEFVETEPEFLYASHEGSCVWDMLLDGNKLYASVNNFFMVFELKDHSLKKIKAVFTEEFVPLWLRKYGKYILAGVFMGSSAPIAIDTTDGYKIVRLSLKGLPEDAAFATYATYVENGKIYLIGNGICQTDASNFPELKVEKAVLTDSNGDEIDISRGVIVKDGYVFGNSADFGVVYEVADLKNMKYASVDISSVPSLAAFAKEGRTLYALPNVGKKLLAIDVLNPMKPQLKWSIDTEKEFSSVAVYQGYIYLAGSDVSYIGVYEAAPFKDVSTNYWAIKAINFMVSRNIISGYPDGTFKPEKIVTRAEYAKMLALSLGLKIGEGRDIYVDVPKSHWAYKYITAVTDAKLMKGYGKGKFGPNDTVKKEEIITTIVRLKNWTLVNPPSGTFPDVPRKYWAYPYIETAVKHGLISKVDRGLTDGSFHIKVGATRAQTAELLYRAIGNR